MQLFFILILTHFISDFMLQGNIIGPGKYGFNYYMWAHVTITALINTIPLLIFSIAPNLILISIVIIFTTHLAIDAVRSYANRHFHWGPNDSPFWVILGLDQIFHVVVLYLIVSQVLAG